MHLRSNVVVVRPGVDSPFDKFTFVFASKQLNSILSTLFEIASIYKQMSIVLYPCAQILY